MKRWIKRTLIGLIGSAALFGGLAAWAQNHHYRHGAMTEQDAVAMKARIVEKVSSKLDLDAAQKAKFGTLADAVRTQRKALMGSSGDPRAEIQGLVAGNTFDRAKAQQLLAAKMAAVNEQSPAVITALGDFYDSLRPDQQAKVRDFMSRHHRGERGPRS